MNSDKKKLFARFGLSWSDDTGSINRSLFLYWGIENQPTEYTTIARLVILTRSIKYKTFDKARDTKVLIRDGSLLEVRSITHINEHLKSETGLDITINELMFADDEKIRLFARLVMRSGLSYE